jgi:HD-GYP domain-containing protein (c-di-GMP phosphodiesterase class II)
MISSLVKNAEVTVVSDSEGRGAVCQSAVATLGRFFSADFTIWNDGEVLHAGGGPARVDQLATAELVRAAAEANCPQFTTDAETVVILAVPFPGLDNTPWVATAAFATQRLESDENASDAARLLGLDERQVREWHAAQTIWTPEMLLRVATAVAEKLAAEAEAQRMAREVELISQNLVSSYEEISLLYSITQNLRISSSDEELGQLAIDWMGDCVPAEAFAVQYLPVNEAGDSLGRCRARTRSVLITRGECPLDDEDFQRLVDKLDLHSATGPVVVNPGSTQDATWEFPQVRQLVLAPLAESDNVFGYLAAFNHLDGKEFGTVEANLISSLGTLLGIHSGNRELYRQQSELLANVVRALVSAIDAKDPYTSGHSDRVARFAVRIALEMRCNPKSLNTIYMAGLLHDVGKIGIDDNVLRKAGRLTEAEYEHVKLHPELGHRILADLKQLADVLPAVLHHHEQWDGAGYPHGLESVDIPQIARIMAVADAFDAMTSDRPYRDGMPIEKVDSIFREGAGKFWDPDVVDAYFKAKPDIEEISRRERANCHFAEPSWT